MGSNVWTLEKVNQSRREAERDVILETLETTRWNHKRAADLLQIDYKALLYKMKKLGLDEGGRVATVAQLLIYGMGYGWDSRGTARVQTRIALTEEQATDNRI